MPQEICSTADIVIAAVGKPEVVKGDWIKPGAAVIDVGTNAVDVSPFNPRQRLLVSVPLRHFHRGLQIVRRSIGCQVSDGFCLQDSTKKRGYRLVGDVDFKEASKHAGHITPVPGGVGPMTITMLLSNTIEGAARSFKQQ